MQITDYIPTVGTLRNVLDIALVFIIVYVVLKLLRGTRAVPTVVGMVILGLLYWLAVAQELTTLEAVLRSAVPYIGFVVIILFASEIRQALPEADRPRIDFLPVRDYYDTARWVTAVRQGVAAIAGSDRADVLLIGHHKDATSAYLDDLPGWVFEDAGSQGAIHASALRDAWFGAAGHSLEAALAALVGQAPPNPPVARKARIEGEVVLELLVGTSGAVDSVEVIKPMPFGLSEAAMAAVREWRFQPRQEPAHVQVVIRFQMVARDAHPPPP